VCLSLSLSLSVVKVTDHASLQSFELIRMLMLPHTYAYAASYVCVCACSRRID
jgi:hypothetical protein